MKYECLKIKFILFLVFWILALFTNVLYSQNEPLYTQFLNNHITTNPAYTGTRNTLAVDLTTRKQWFGVDNSPTTQLLTLHAPINKTRVSLGGAISTDWVGLERVSQALFSYSYLVRINVGMFLSLGLNAGVNNYHFNYSGIKLIDLGDQFFEAKRADEFKPLVGVGAILFTRKFRICLSAPQVLTDNLLGNESGIFAQATAHYYASADYNFVFNKKNVMRLSTFSRIPVHGPFMTDYCALYDYKNMLGLGFVYRSNSTMASILNFQVNKNIEVCYSYDFPLKNNGSFKQGSHELTLKYDIYKFYRRNKYRIFNKKKTEEEPQTLRSIRYF